MTDTTSINQSHKRLMADDRLASLLLILGLISAPVFCGTFGYLYSATARTQSLLAAYLLLIFLAVGFCSCVASAFFTSYSLRGRFLLALLAVGLFAADFFISLVLAVCFFGLD